MFTNLIICASIALAATIVGTLSNNDVNLSIVAHQKFQAVTFIDVHKSNTTNHVNATVAQKFNRTEVNSALSDGSEQSLNNTKGLLFGYYSLRPTAIPIVVPVYVNVGDVYINSTFINVTNTNSTLTNNTNTGSV